MTEEREGLRGDELAHETPEPGPAPEAPKGGLRGEELADAAGGVGEVPGEQTPDAELAKNSPRGDGLAEDA
jgi:hypothetical protein